MSNTNNHNQLPAMPVNAGLDNDNGRVSNEDIRKYVADSAQQMSFRCLFPQEVHDRMWQLFRMTVRFTQREMEQDLSFAPLAVAREFLKKEHHAYVLDREKWATEERIMGLRRQELAIERQCIAAEKAKIVAVQRKLAAERLQFEAEKNIIRAGQKVPGLIARRPAMISISEQQRMPPTIPTSENQDPSATREPQIRSKNVQPEDTPDTALNQNLKRRRSNMEAAPDKTSNTSTLQQVRHPKPAKPAPINITLLKGCVRTTAKVVDLLILKHPHDTVSRPKQRDPNISTPVITSIISSLFAKGNEHRLRNWRAFEREGAPDRWYCWLSVLDPDHGDTTLRETSTCRCEKLGNVAVFVPIWYGCIWVCKDGLTGLLSFVWRDVWEKLEGHGGY